MVSKLSIKIIRVEVILRDRPTVTSVQETMYTGSFLVESADLPFGEKTVLPGRIITTDSFQHSLEARMTKALMKTIVVCKS
jgi:hypothetical protein